MRRVRPRFLGSLGAGNVKFRPMDSWLTAGFGGKAGEYTSRHEVSSCAGAKGPGLKPLFVGPEFRGLKAPAPSGSPFGRGRIRPPGRPSGEEGFGLRARK